MSSVAHSVSVIDVEPTPNETDGERLIPKQDDGGRMSPNEGDDSRMLPPKQFDEERSYPNPDGDERALPKTTELEEAVAREKRRILYNVCLLSVAFMVHFTAFQGASNLQSTINAGNGLGTASLATIYGSLVISSMFIPVVMIRYLGCKWSIVVSLSAYMPYIVAQIHPTFYTLIPAAVMVGLGGGPLLCSKAKYLCVMARYYQKLTGISTEVLTVRFFGVFFMFFQLAQIWGNLISSAVLSIQDVAKPYHVSDLENCGADFCPSSYAGNPNLVRPSDRKIYTIAGIYLGCMMLAVLLVVFGLDSLDRYGESKREGEGDGLTGIQLVVATFRQLKEKNQLLILPLTVWLGAQQAFLVADFTLSYVACAWSIHNVGYVLMSYGLCNSMSSVLAGWLVKMTGRLPVVCGAALLQLNVLLALLYWNPNKEKSSFFFIVTGFWGLCDGVWMVQVNALYGILFAGREEAAYSNFWLWQSLGFIGAFSYSAYLCTPTKLYFVLGLLAVGISGYVSIEVSEAKKARGK